MEERKKEGGKEREMEKEDEEIKKGREEDGRMEKTQRLEIKTN